MVKNEFEKGTRKKDYVLKNGRKQDFLLLNLINMAWCFCDECE